MNSVAVSSDGRRIVSGSADKTVVVWDLEAATPIRQLTGHQAPVWAVALSPDGRHVAAGSSDATVVVWDVDSGQRLATLALDGTIPSLTWDRDGRFVLAGDTGGNIYRLEFREY